MLATKEEIAEKTVSVGVRMSRELGDRLAALSKKSGRPMSYYVKEAIVQCLPTQEAVQQAEQSYRDMLDGKIDYIEHEDVRARLLAKRNAGHQ
jgi:predicted DNA-binding protein